MKTKQTEGGFRSAGIITRPLPPRKPEAAPAQAQHSPLPWRRAGGMVDGYAIVSSDNHAVVSQKLPSYNASFIVRACNNAQRLADAAKQVERDWNITRRKHLPSSMAKLREALAEWNKQK